MKNKNAVARYRLIDNRMTMKQKPAPTLLEIVDYVCEKLATTVSVSSIQKDIYAMRFDENLAFFAPIEFDTYKKGYVYTDPDYSIHKLPVSEEDLHGIEIAVSILEQFKELPAIKLFDDAINKIATLVKYNRNQNNDSKIVLLDRPKKYKGIEHFSEIVEAIKNKNVMKITYMPFNKKEIKKHTVHPYFIKEYNGRMYLIAKGIHATKQSKFLTFAFDRLNEVIKMNQTYVPEYIDKENYFNSIIGISQTDSKPVKIHLQFHTTQAAYIKSQPIHHSQKIIKDNKYNFVIEINVMINYEFIALLLSFGDKVKVLKPTSLAITVKEIVSNMLALYN